MQLIYFNCSNKHPAIKSCAQNTKCVKLSELIGQIKVLTKQALMSGNRFAEIGVCHSDKTCDMIRSTFYFVVRLNDCAYIIVDCHWLNQWNLINIFGTLSVWSSVLNVFVLIRFPSLALDYCLICVNDGT